MVNTIPEVLRERLRSDAGWFSGQKGCVGLIGRGGRGSNFSVSRSEGLEHLFQSSSGFGLIPMVPVAGRPSLRRVLGLTGMELMFIRVLPGDSSPSRCGTEGMRSPTLSFGTWPVPD